MKIAFKTFGCKANSVDTDVLYGEARRRGHEIVSDESAAEAYIINSCTVTDHADRDARVAALRYKRQHPEAKVAVVGCYAQVAKEELLALPQVDYVIGTAEKMRVLDLLARPEVSDFRDQVQPATGFLPETFRGSRYARANIKIQDGCNFSCSFCIIPQARGRSRSLPIEVIERQVQEAEAQGFAEVILTGIHLAHYGWDLNTDLVALLRRLLASSRGPRIRLSTLDPFEIPEPLLEWLAGEPRLCPHFHIALQSGNDRVLKGMRRIYRAQEFVDITRRIGSIQPDTFIGVDVIVGFPGEDAPAFQDTVQVLEDSFWSKLHVFPYSVRRGTRAETLPQPVESAEKTRRSVVLRELSAQRLQRFLSSQVGKTKQVILERPVEARPGWWTAHSENYLLGEIPVAKGETKTLLPATILDLRGEKVIFSPVSSSSLPASWSRPTSLPAPAQY